jgi:hypothetical protein
MKSRNYLTFTLVTIFASSSVHAAKETPVEPVKCEKSFGTIAVVEGDTQGWSKFGLGSPRELISALVAQSGCFTLHDPSSGQNAKYLMNVIAGDKEEVDKGMEMAKTAAANALVRSGAAGTLLGRVPMGGAMLGMLGGLGGKKKTVAAGIRMISPASGATMVSGSGEVRKSSLTFGGINGGWQQGAVSAGYANSKDGQMLTEAFVRAYNSVVTQGSALGAAGPVAAIVSTNAIVAAATSMYSAPNKTAAVTRALRAETSLTPTGKRDGLFIEVTDSYGTTGWVSVEDLK